MGKRPLRGVWRDDGGIGNAWLCHRQPCHHDEADAGNRACSRCRRRWRNASGGGCGARRQERAVVWLRFLRGNNANRRRIRGGCRVYRRRDNHPYFRHHRNGYARAGSRVCGRLGEPHEAPELQAHVRSILREPVCRVQPFWARLLCQLRSESQRHHVDVQTGTGRGTGDNQRIASAGVACEALQRVRKLRQRHRDYPIWRDERSGVF